LVIFRAEKETPELPEAGLILAISKCPGFRASNQKFLFENSCPKSWCARNEYSTIGGIIH
jgi:hypothetical protein